MLLQNPVAYFQKILYHSSWPLSFPFVSVGTNILDFSMAFFYPKLRTLLYTIDGNFRTNEKADMANDYQGEIKKSVRTRWILW